MKQESIERLNQLKGVFDTFKMVGAVKPSHSELTEMASVYREEFNRDVNMYCSACVIEMINILFGALERDTKLKTKSEDKPKEVVEDKPKANDSKKKK